MSYSFGMFFKQVNNTDEAMEILNKSAQILISQARDYIHDNQYYIPSVDQMKYLPETDRYWLYSLFTLKFTYWKEEKLLALSGYHYPEEIEKLFDTHVCFQNGTDQDYPYKEWDNKIAVFAKEKQKVKLMKSKDVYKYFEIDKKEQNASNAAYWKRSMLYKNIFNRLELGLYIDGQHDMTNLFQVLNVCAINDVFTLSKLSAYVRKYSGQYRK